MVIGAIIGAFSNPQWSEQCHELEHPWVPGEEHLFLLLLVFLFSEQVRTIQVYLNAPISCIGKVPS